jgi:hypothetical protein
VASIKTNDGLTLSCGSTKNNPITFSHQFSKFLDTKKIDKILGPGFAELLKNFLRSNFELE